MKCQILFSGKNMKNINSLSSTELAQRVVKIKVSLFVLRFYGPFNPTGSCRTRSVYLTTLKSANHNCSR